ncbi:14345_t:CDS:2 [Entrophospora sp. SA101]|nr:14345_t:CDS:2 [Entrophospora sp. SA101]
MSISSIGDLLPDNVNSLILGEHERRGSDSDITFPLRHPLRPSFKQKFRAPLLELNRYKYIVNVSILENKGAGVRMQVNCLWDSDTDNLAQETFKNNKGQEYLEIEARDILNFKQQAGILEGEWDEVVSRNLKETEIKNFVGMAISKLVDTYKDNCDPNSNDYRRVSGWITATNEKRKVQGFWGLAFRVWVTGIVITGYRFAQSLEAFSEFKCFFFFREEANLPIGKTRDKPALNWCLDKKGWSTQK